MRVTVLNGPNLNLLGTREPELYGRLTLDEIETLVRAEADGLGIAVQWLQSNHEGQLIEAIQALPGSADGLILNGGAYTHTSVAMRDALLAVRIPFVEVHLSNLFAREPARRQSLFADLAIGVVTGFGATGYLLALRALHGRRGDG
jgi:3-dehydroquinate dehydratase-2